MRAKRGDHGADRLAQGTVHACITAAGMATGAAELTLALALAPMPVLVAVPVTGTSGPKPGRLVRFWCLESVSRAGDSAKGADPSHGQIGIEAGGQGKGQGLGGGRGRGLE